MELRAPLHFFAEYFTLKKADSDAKALSPEAHTALVRAIGLCQQKREAAQILWTQGCNAEALCLARGASTCLLAGLEGVGESLPGFESKSKEHLAALQALDEEKLPERDAEIAPAHALMFEKTLAHQAHLISLFTHVAYTSRERFWLRVRRIAWTAGALVLAIVVLVLVFRTPKQLRVEAASATLNDDHKPSFVVDGDPMTNWALPDGATGWIDLQVVPARVVTNVRIMNASNAPHLDRATKDFVLHFYAKGREVQSVPGSFPTFNPKPDFQSFPTNTNQVIDKIRLEIKSNHLKSAAISEIVAD
jgi:hypothetical protein